MGRRRETGSRSGTAKAWAWREGLGLVGPARSVARMRRQEKSTTSGRRPSWPSRDQTLRSRSVKLLGAPWELTVNPERGGRVTSLRLDGTELLEQGIGVDEPAATDFA